MSNILKYKVLETKIQLPDSGFNSYIKYLSWKTSPTVLKWVSQLNFFASWWNFAASNAIVE